MSTFETNCSITLKIAKNGQRSLAEEEKHSTMDCNLTSHPVALGWVQISAWECFLPLFLPTDFYHDSSHSTSPITSIHA